jgi:hypothetical protein
MEWGRWKRILEWNGKSQRREGGMGRALRRRKKETGRKGEQKKEGRRYREKGNGTIRFKKWSGKRKEGNDWKHTI